MFRLMSSTDVRIMDNPEILATLKYPLFASAKLDGIRGGIVDFTILSRSNKPLPNYQTAEDFCYADGLDGEFIVGSPTAEDCISVTQSGIMSHEGDPKATFYVFDYCFPQFRWSPYMKRLQALETYVKQLNDPRIILLPQVLLERPEDVLAFEQKHLDEGYEGVMLRSMHGHYKYGQATLKEQYLLKLKRFTDVEVHIEGFVEAVRNTNEQTRDEQGLAKRSQAKSGLVSSGTLGKIITTYNGLEMTIGCGKMKHPERLKVWQNQASYKGRMFTMRFFGYGMKDVPRMARFHTWRTPGF